MHKNGVRSINVYGNLSSLHQLKREKFNKERHLRTMENAGVGDRTFRYLSLRKRKINLCSKAIFLTVFKITV